MYKRRTGQPSLLDSPGLSGIILWMAFEERYRCSDEDVVS